MLLVSRHGMDAITVAEQEASRYQREDDALTASVWRWILRDVSDLLRTEPEGRERVH